MSDIKPPRLHLGEKTIRILFLRVRRVRILTVSKIYRPALKCRKTPTSHRYGPSRSISSILCVIVSMG
jgi:hypothetical protein